MHRRLLLLGTLLAAAPARADDDDDEEDHERARRALERGEIRPLSALLAEVERRYVGRVIETDLERKDGRWVYELKLLPPTGRVYELRLDAATGALLRSRGPVQERR